MAEKKKTLPNNFQMTWQRNNDYSAARIDTRKIVGGVASGAGRRTVLDIRNDKIQIEEQVFLDTFHKAILLCSQMPGHLVSFIRIDHSKYIPQNENNRPFRVTDDEGVKEMEYAGYTYISDMGEIKEYDQKDIKQKLRAIKRREKKGKLKS